MVQHTVGNDSNMVKFVLKLNLDVNNQVASVKRDYGNLQRELERKEEQNLRIRDAIENVKNAKEDLLNSIVPTIPPLSQMCAIM